jgi:DNA-damage-inducible protein D
MSQDGTSQHLVPFDDEIAEQQIRHVWQEGRWWYSVIDVIALLTDNSKPRQYWFDMKRTIHTEGFHEVSEKIRQLKMTAADGKQRLTDAADTETLLRIIQSIPSPKAEPFKRWLARVGTERLEEIENPELAADRMRQLYRARGYSDEWIDRRPQGIVVRDELTQEWRERGAEEGRQFAVLTDILSQGTFDVSTAKHKQIKQLKPRDNLRDSMTTMELLLTALSEETAKTLHQVHDSQGIKRLKSDAREAGEVAGATRRDIETRTGQPVVSTENYKTLTARQRQPQLFDDEG